ncbi:MAG: glycosyltransferase [Calditrichaceae bacterium]
MMNKKNILLIKDSSGIFGSERVILTLLNNYDKDRFNISLICMRRGDGKSDKLIEQAAGIGANVIPIDVNGRLDTGAIVKMRRILKKESINIIHTHDFKSDFYGLAASINLPVKRIATAHGSTKDSLLKKTYLFFTERIIYHFFHSIIAVSNQIYGDLQKHMPGGKVKVIQNGIDLSILGNGSPEEDQNPVFTENGKKVFAVVGRLFPDKGHRFFINAFARVLNKFPETAALIVGDGPAREEIESQISNLRLEKNISLCGVRNDMNNVYEKIDFLVIPSLREGLPYVLLEAMSKKIPVIATSVGDIPVLIQNDKTGYLISPADEAALEKSMLDCLVDEARASRIADNAFKLVNQKYSGRKMVQDTESLYFSFIN